MTGTTTIDNPRAFGLVTMKLRMELARRAVPGYPIITDSGDPAADGAPLDEWELRQLAVIALGESRRSERDRQRLATRRRTRDGLRDDARRAVELAARYVLDAQQSLIASIGAGGAPTVAWSGVLTAEGRPTGDGRLIRPDALSWETPLPLRWTPADFGGHDGAQLVGRIDTIERRPGGMIWGRGVIDTGSPAGQEVARLMGAGMLSGVSVDLDSTEMSTLTLATTGGQPQEVAVVDSGRVRGATLCDIPAFAEAQLSLDDPDAAQLVELDSGAVAGHSPDCGCDAGGASSLLLHGPAASTTAPAPTAAPSAPPGTLPDLSDTAYFPGMGDLPVPARSNRSHS